jgi:glycosyltransferase involved in cell wall biosynthesis
MNASISSYTTTYNCQRMQYPLEECVRSLLGFSDEVCIVDAGSNDGTVEMMTSWAAREARIKFFVEPVDFSNPRWAVRMDGMLKAAARRKCTGDFCWQTDTDEIVVPHDFNRIRALPGALRDVIGQHPIIFLPMIEFWGSFENIRADFLSWKPRFSRNHPNITHGVPLDFRMYDPEGHIYPRPFESDSCNYMWADSQESVPLLFPIQIEKIDMSPAEFDAFMHNSLEMLPSVLHVSWLNLRRKIQHYRALWTRFHSSMYNLADADVPERNTIFNKRWSEVTDREIDAKAEELKRLGPRFYSQTATFQKNQSSGAMVRFRGAIPDSLRQWAQAVEQAPTPANLI